MRKYYDMMDDGEGGWISTCNPNYDPNKKSWFRKIIEQIINFLTK